MEIRVDLKRNFVADLHVRGVIQKVKDTREDVVYLLGTERTRDIDSS